MGVQTPRLHTDTLCGHLSSDNFIKAWRTALKFILLAILLGRLSWSRISFSQPIFHSSVENYLHFSYEVTSRLLRAYSSLKNGGKMYLLEDSYAQKMNRYFTSTFRRSIGEETPLSESTSLPYAGSPMYLRYLKAILYKAILKRL